MGKAVWIDWAAKKEWLKNKMNEIRPWLLIGAYRDTLNKSYLDFKSIRAMLQLAERVEQPDIVSLYLPVEDVAPISSKHIRQGVDFIREQKQIGSRVLVACGAGINRSSAFSAAALKEEEGLGLFDAFKEVQQCLPESMPHEPVWTSLCEYYDDHTPYLEVMRLGIEFSQLRQCAFEFQLERIQRIPSYWRETQESDSGGTISSSHSKSPRRLGL